MYCINIVLLNIIFTLRQIVERVVAKQIPVMINFIDFGKICDSANKGSLWKIIEKYWIPANIIEIVKTLYDDG